MWIPQDQAANHWIAEVGGQCVVGLPDKELGKLFEEGGQVIVNIAILNVKVNVNHDQQ